MDLDSVNNGTLVRAAAHILCGTVRVKQVQREFRRKFGDDRQRGAASSREYSCIHAAYGTVTIRGGQSVHSLSENCSIQLYPREDEHLRLETCRGE